MKCKCHEYEELVGNEATKFRKDFLINISVDAYEWKGLYRCKFCGNYWEENFISQRFADIPKLNKVSEDYAKTYWEI